MATIERLARGLGLTKAGREALEAAKEEEARLAERAAARGLLNDALADEEELPKLAAAMDKASTKLTTTTARLQQAYADAERAYREAVGSFDRRRHRAEGTLRRTAPGLVSDSGPVVLALEGAIRHLRSHLLPVGDEDRMRRAAKEAAPLKMPEKGLWERVRAEVALADAAIERLVAVEAALDAIRDLQLQIDVNHAERAAEILSETTPERCACGLDLRLHSAIPNPQEH